MLTQVPLSLIAKNTCLFHRIHSATSSPIKRHQECKFVAYDDEASIKCFMNPVLNCFRAKRMQLIQRNKLRRLHMKIGWNYEKKGLVESVLTVLGQCWETRNRMCMHLSNNRLGFR